MLVYALWDDTIKKWFGPSNSPVPYTSAPKIWTQRHNADYCRKQGKASYWCRPNFYRTNSVPYKWTIVRLEVTVATVDKSLVNP